MLTLEANDPSEELVVCRSELSEVLLAKSDPVCFYQECILLIVYTWYYRPLRRDNEWAVTMSSADCVFCVLASAVWMKTRTRPFRPLFMISGVDCLGFSLMAWFPVLRHCCSPCSSESFSANACSVALPPALCSSSLNRENTTVYVCSYYGEP